MTHFPVFQSLSIEGYALYPGRAGTGGSNARLETTLGDGPWVVLGVNGLGKSTLLLLLKHLVIGPVRARDAGFTGERSDLVSIDARFFAARVGDGARAASAELGVRIGRTTLKIRRRLSDLGIISAEADGKPMVAEERAWRELLVAQMGLSQFEDVVRVIDRVVFRLESAPPLIWDVSAQFELFRALLTPDESQELRRLEGEIVSSDSAARNLNAAIAKLAARRDQQVRMLEGSATTKVEIATARAQLDKSRADEQSQGDALEKATVRLTDARLRLRRAEQSLDSKTGEYEELKYQLLRHAFAGVPPNDQYVFLKIITERVCLACGNVADEAADLLAKRQKDGRCLVCGSPRHDDHVVVSTASALQRKANRAFAEVEAARSEIALAAVEQDEADKSHRACQAVLDSTRSKVDGLADTLRRLQRRLPQKDQSELAREEDNIQRLRNEVLAFRKERDEAERAISALLDRLTAATVAIRAKLEHAFRTLAVEFFAEKTRLVYAPRRERIGQYGRIFEFPAFEVEMTSGATEAEFVRRTPDQVSLSQREYLDTIFRMSLLQVLASSGCSLVVDGPEGSLDAVFAGRAGTLFAAFAGRKNRNLVLACNIIDGEFLPSVLASYPNGKGRAARLVNLMDLGSPTAALRILHDEYQRALAAVLSAPVRR